MRARSKHFLVVEDNQDDAFILMRAFRTVPLCTAYVARNSSEARAYLFGAGIYEDRLNFPFPDGVVLGLPALPDVVFVQWLGEAFPNLSVFALTAGAPPATVDHLRRLGAKEVIERPITIDAVRELLQRLVQDICQNA